MKKNLKMSMPSDENLTNRMYPDSTADGVTYRWGARSVGSIKRTLWKVSMFTIFIEIRVL